MNRLNKIRMKLDVIFNTARSKWTQYFEAFTVFLVFIMCTAFVMDTYELSDKTQHALELIQIWITCFFALEYLVRWWVKRFSMRYPFSFFAILDMMSIVPIFFIHSNFQIVKLLRLFRILRLLRFLQKANVFFKHPYNIRVANILFSLFTLVFISAGIMYDIEHPYNPEFNSFVDGVYFSIVTLTTVGYGDVVPITTLGRLAAIAIISVGGLLIPWQLTMLAKSLIAAEDKTLRKECPDCKNIEHLKIAKFCNRCGGALHKVGKV